jgi:hypothetical protein
MQFQAVKITSHVIVARELHSRSKNFLTAQAMATWQQQIVPYSPAVQVGLLILFSQILLHAKQIMMTFIVAHLLFQTVVAGAKKYLVECR